MTILSVPTIPESYRVSEESVLRKSAQDAVESLERLEQTFARCLQVQPESSSRYNDKSKYIWIPHPGKSGYLSDAMIRDFAYVIRQCLDPSLPHPFRVKNWSNRIFR